MGGCHSICTAASLPDEIWDHDIWSVGPRSSEAYAAGDVVEDCLCLNVPVDELQGTAFEGRSFPHPSGPSCSLIPLGLGMMYRHSSNPSLNAKYVHRGGRPWLRFTAIRALKAGEPLTISLGQARNSEKSLVDATPGWAEAGTWSMDGRSDWLDSTLYNILTPEILLPLDPAVRLANMRVDDSPFGGFGVFARRPYASGDIIDVALSVPLINHNFKAAEDYVYDATMFLSPKPDVSFLDCFNLGVAMIFNHSSAVDNIELTFAKADGFFLIFMFASRDVDEGEELLLNYGDDYWGARQAELQQLT